MNNEVVERISLAVKQVAQMACSGRLSASATRLLLRMLLREYAALATPPREPQPVLNSAPPGHDCHAKLRPCPYNKGTTREHKTPRAPHRVYRVDQRQTMHKQVGELAAAIERAAQDGARLEAVIYRPEFGELTLDCGNPGKSTDPIGKGGHGVQHALEGRHNISPRAMAETLLLGEVGSHKYSSSRLTIDYKAYEVIIEREMKKASGRTSNTRAKVQTAMKKE